MAKRVEPEVEFSGLLLKGIEHAFCENAMALRFSVQLKRTEWEKLCELSEVLGKDVEMVLRNIVKSGINKWYEELCEIDILPALKCEDSLRGGLSYQGVHSW